MTSPSTPASTRQRGDRNAPNGLVRACTLEALQRDGVRTLIGHGPAITIFWHEGNVYAVDNRCPHMGFPLARGYCKDGILTCYWHYARFDLASGGTFDPWADDLRVYPVKIQGGDVWVDLGSSRVDGEQRSRAVKRLLTGLDQNIPLVQAKAILALLAVAPDDGVIEIIRTTASYGLQFGSERNPSGWGDGLTILTAMANLRDQLAPEDRPLALYHGVRRTGDDAAGRMQRVELSPLPSTGIAPDRLKQWFRQFIEVRDAQAAERALRSAIVAGLTPVALIDILTAAATDHYYRDFSHVMDTLAKVIELLDLIGWDQAQVVLPSVVAQWASSTREEENNSWRHPEDLVAIVEDASAQLNRALDLSAEPGSGWPDSLVDVLLGDDPAGSINAVMDAFRTGVALADAAQALACASALRLARFPTSNEFSDWDTALHHFTYCASLAQVARRAPSVELARGVLHGAMIVYQARFLNVPAARLPGIRALSTMPEDPETLLQQLSDICEQQGGVDEAGAFTYRYLSLGHEPAALIRTLGRSVLREDPGFHDFQMLEEGVQLARSLFAAGKAEAAHQTLVAIARWQAAHAPTRRATTQTYETALRLHRGENIYGE